MRAILIDPAAKTVTETDGDYRSLGAIYEALNCAMIEGPQLDEDIYAYVDEEGLYVVGQHYFKAAWQDQPVAGRALIVGGDNRGETVALPDRITIEAIREKVRFYETQPVFQDMRTVSVDNAPMPWGGTGFAIIHTPVFDPPGTLAP